MGQGGFQPTLGLIASGASQDGSTHGSDCYSSVFGAHQEIKILAAVEVFSKATERLESFYANAVALIAIGQPQKMRTDIGTDGIQKRLGGTVGIKRKRTVADDFVLR